MMQFLNREQVVRDLIWAIESSPVMASSKAMPLWLDGNWFLHQSNESAKLFSSLHDDPDPLLSFLNSRPTHRLGVYFESLWHFWLTRQSRYELVESNLVVRDEKRTLGEFDLIVRDVERGKTLHWELAVKFYLGVGETNNLSNWWGPRQRDRLDIKVNHLVNHQTQLSNQQAARQQLASRGIHIDETWVILKGRLFYPYAQKMIAPDGSAENHGRGRWLSDSEFSNNDELLDLDWLPLSRAQWFAPIINVAATEVVNGRSLVKQWDATPIERPCCFACVDSGSEKYRIFVTQSDWESSIATQDL